MIVFGEDRLDPSLAIATVRGIMRMVLHFLSAKKEILDILSSDNLIINKPIETKQNVKQINGKRQISWAGVLPLYRLMDTYNTYQHRIRILLIYLVLYQYQCTDSHSTDV